MSNNYVCKQSGVKGLEIMGMSTLGTCFHPPLHSALHLYLRLVFFSHFLLGIPATPERQHSLSVAHPHQSPGCFLVIEELQHFSNYYVTNDINFSQNSDKPAIYINFKARF